MSHDLFAAFGSPEATGSGTSGAVPNEQDLWKQDESLGVQGQALKDEEDDFGDFEDASTANVASSAPQTQTQPPPARSPFPPKATKPSPKEPKRSGAPARPSKPASEVGQHPFAGKWDLLFDADDDEYDAGADEITDLATNPEAAMAYSKRVIEAQQAEERKAQKGSLPSAPAVPERQQRADGLKVEKKNVPAKLHDPDLLFDAETDVQDDDDFGDFEDVGATSEPIKQAESTGAQVSLPTMDLSSLNESTPQPPQSNAKRKSPAPPILPSTVVDDEAWDDFEESATDAGYRSTTSADQLPALTLPLQRSAAAMAAEPATSTRPDALPPTNIPPPAVLLSIFPSIFASGQEALFDTVAKLELKQRQVLLAHPATHMFLRGYLSLAIVLGHIIAGRKQRWKRDQYLAQGMRIGPAAAGGKGGMKLTGVDKGEVAKEDREVLDVVRLWKGQVGKLRSAVVAASAATANGEAKLPTVPEIAEQLPVKTLKPSEGGVTATAACALCGLKREERVAKVDVEIQDSFGEWWVDGMNMHLVCRNFWEEHKAKLKSR